MNKTLKCCFISHEKASLEIREKVALRNEEMSAFLNFLKGKSFAGEFFVLSTCNRTELYYLSDKDKKDSFVRLISEFKNDASILAQREFFSCENDPEKTIYRLFEIANGIHSQVLGDLQIINQIKNAYASACECKTVGSYMHRLLQTLFSCYKSVAHETDIHAGAASVSYAAMEIARDFLKKEKNRPVLVVGAGDFSRQVIEQFKKRGINNITITNRSAERAQKLAKQYQLRTIPFEELEDLWCFDVIVSCISSPEIVINKDHFEIHSLNHKLLIDLSVPRSIDPELGMMSGIRLINMNQITEKNKAALAKRRESIPAARELIARFCDEFFKWQASMSERPILHTLRNTIEEIRLKEIDKMMRKSKNNLSEKEMIDQITLNIVKKIIKTPAVKLHQSGQNRRYLSQALATLFDLEKPENHSIHV